MRPTVARGASAPPATLLSARGITKAYRKGQVEIPVLRGVDLEVQQGEFLSIIGQSGSGKSTLLHICATLDQADAGEIHFAGQRIDNLPRSRRDALRNKRFGMIFQFYHLLPELTALENVLSPLMIGQGVFEYLRNRKAHQRAGRRTADQGRPGPPAEAQAARTVRRRNAARGHRPGVGRRARGPVRRRTDRQSRHRQRRGNPGRSCEP